MLRTKPLFWGVTLLLVMGCEHPQVEPFGPLVMVAPPVPPTPVPVQPSGMVKVSGGTFTMGSGDFTDAKPIQGMSVASFYLDQTEVTAEAYQACVTAKKCSMPVWAVKDSSTYNYDRARRQVVPGKERHPINGVTFQQAKDYCQVQGKRLPTEVEWEYAARGTTNHKYPWGDEDPGTTHACWNQTTGTCAVKAYGATLLGMNQSQLDAKKMQGIYDLAGNVWVWVDTQYADTLSATNTPCTDPSPMSSCVIRGGSWSSYDPLYLLSSFRGNVNPKDSYDDLGFRCARAE